MVRILCQMQWGWLWGRTSEDPAEQVPHWGDCPSFLKTLRCPPWCGCGAGWDISSMAHRKGHPYLTPFYPAAYHIVVRVKQCGMTYVGLFQQVSLHEMQACARKKETRVTALTRSGRSNSTVPKIWGYQCSNTEVKAAACTGKQNQPGTGRELAKSCFGW